MMRADVIIEAARQCYPSEFTVNDIVRMSPVAPRGVSEYSVKCDVRAKLNGLCKYGIVDRRLCGRSVFYRYVMADGGSVR